MLLRRNRDERAEKARFPFEDIEIRQRAKAGAELAQPHAPHILRRRHRVALGLDPHMQGDKQRPFAVEALGDDNEVVGVEHFPGTDDRVEGTETGIVQYDIRGIDAAFNQVPTHGHRFIVALQSIIAAQQEIVPIAQLLTAERLDALIRQYDPLSADTPPLDFRQVRGMLKGFIDLVFRHEGRYYLLDYKSNWLGEDREAYTRPAMEQAMRAHRYDLQYQLYSLALHRYLRHRLADYDYDRHFGGVIYLFLRGMDGQEGGQGIFTTRPVRPLIDGLDQLFAGETQEEAS